MSLDIFEQVKACLQPNVLNVLQDLLPGGKVVGREYLCASLQGGVGKSCVTNLETGIGSDFATGDSWGDVIALGAKVWGIGQFEAVQALSKLYHLEAENKTASKYPQKTQEFTYLLPIPSNAPIFPTFHAIHGKASAFWGYKDAQGNALFYTVRFDKPDGKVVLPLCFGKNAQSSPQWVWKALPENRPLYGLEKFAYFTEDITVLIVEGEKTADAAQVLFPDYLVTTWSGGGNAVSKTDFTPLRDKKVIIWPDNDEAGFKAAVELAKLLEVLAQDIKIVLPPISLPEKWDLADQLPTDFIPQTCLGSVLNVVDFIQEMNKRFASHISVTSIEDSFLSESDALTLKEWPKFSLKAYPGILGDFVNLTISDSEADPAAVCVTTLVRFGAEVYGYAPNKGPYIYVGETIHPPRLFAVICGNSSKARKGTSKYPVTKLFSRDYCQSSDLINWKLPLSARESGGPLSTGEGLAFHVRDETDEERERWQRQHPNEPFREKGDKRLIIQDEEFASGLACTKREGNTLSMGIRCFWDSGDYAPLTKNNPVLVRGAHISIITHITMQELTVALENVQAVNGFGNRFLWICARRAKLVALPSRMPEAKLAPIQRELWKLIATAQKRGVMSMTKKARELWACIYPELSKEHPGLSGGIINRAEAQTLRLSLIYALLDGQEFIDETHLQSALAMWQYAQDSALYIFGERAADPLEEKILTALKAGPLTATELSAVFQRNIPREKLQPLLQQLESQQRISITRQKGLGRPKVIIALYEITTENELNENNEINEISL
ncbi:DUF6371 domain-containing protein [Desulfovibrio litoralis]|uniref:Toprim domain-containing protein n=1 Tax=Desulfovibrio litoralis DSM 11393 TaxID=1121455 RepID=A0A1M7T6Y6_9BACT|nr:DUF6371 domain-containing protein [Desulfovibrio litoralis]SHN66473.1 hypothetical protein SAMN02745728_01652 [Desulfovibrio litoralis DSM 11393]